MVNMPRYCSTPMGGSTKPEVNSHERRFDIGRSAGTLATWRNVVDTVANFAYFTLLWSTIGGGRTIGMRLPGWRDKIAETVVVHVVRGDGRTQRSPSA